MRRSKSQTKTEKRETRSRNKSAKKQDEILYSANSLLAVKILTEAKYMIVKPLANIYKNDTKIKVIEIKKVSETKNDISYSEDDSKEHEIMTKDIIFEFKDFTTKKVISKKKSSLRYVISKKVINQMEEKLDDEEDENYEANENNSDEGSSSSSDEDEEDENDEEEESEEEEVKQVDKKKAAIVKRRKVKVIGKKKETMQIVATKKGKTEKQEEKIIPEIRRSKRLRGPRPQEQEDDELKIEIEAVASKKKSTTMEIETSKNPPDKQKTPTKKDKKITKKESQTIAETTSIEAVKVVKKQKITKGKSKVTKVEKLETEVITEEVEKKKKKKKAPKMPTTFKLGKWNPKVEIVETCQMLESHLNTIIDYGSTKINNKNAIRAAYTKNHILLKAILNSNYKLSSLIDKWGPENDMDLFTLIFKNKDKEGLKLLIEAKHKRTYWLGPTPSFGLREVNTGYNSKYTFGVKVRKVQMMRGGREGNNAFVGDFDTPTDSNNYSDDEKLADKWNKIYEFDTDLEMFTILRTSGLFQSDTNLNQQICLAVRSGNMKIAGSLISYANKRGGFGYNFLHEEVLTITELEKMSEIKKVNCTKKQSGEIILTPIHCACINPNPKILEALLQMAPDSYGLPDELLRKPIHYAAACKGPGPLQILIDKGIDPREGDNSKMTPLMIAAKYGRADNVKVLLNLGDKANLKAKDKENMQAIHFAAMYGHVEVLKVFKEFGVNLNLPGKLKMTPLIMASAYGHFDCVEFLVENKARILSKDKFKRTALAVACRNGNLKIVSYLLRHGANDAEPDSSNNYPLHYAAAYGFEECIEVLMNAGTDPNVENTWKLSPLCVAMLKNYMGCVKKLLSYPQTNVNCKDDRGKTLIATSIESLNAENLERIKYLLEEKKADPNIPDLQGNAPLHYACKMRAENYQVENRNLLVELVKLLLKNGANINAISADQCTPFGIALSINNCKIIEILLDNPDIDLYQVNNQKKGIYHLLEPIIHTDEGMKLFDKISKIVGNKNDMVNIADNDGFTPLLYYVKAYAIQARTILINQYNILYRKLQEKKTQALKEEKKAQGLPWENVYYPITFTETELNALKQQAEDYLDTYTEKFLDILRELIKLGALTKIVVESKIPLQNIINSQYYIGENQRHGNKNALQLISQYPHPKMVDFILENFELDYNNQDIFGMTVLASFIDPHTEIIGYIHKLYDIISKLLAKNCDPNICNNDLIYPLHRVVSQNKLFLFDLLVSYGAKIDVMNNAGDNLAILASRNLNIETLKKIVLAGVDINQANNAKQTAASIILVGPQVETYLETLCELKANLNVVANNNETPLIYWVKRGNLQIVEKLLKAGADPNFRDNMSRTALHHAVNSSNSSDDVSFDMERLLIKHGAKINAIDHRRRTPLHYAFVKIGNPLNTGKIDPVETVTSLCGIKGCKINVKDNWGSTPLHYAAQRGSHISAIYLLNAGANIDQKDYNLNTPLAIAIKSGHSDVAIMLIQSKASISNKIFYDKQKKDKPYIKRYQENTINDLDDDDCVMKLEKAKKPDENSMEEELKLEEYYDIYNMFTIALRNGWQSVTYLMIQNGYDLMNAIQEALNEKKFKYVLTLLTKVSDDKTLKKVNENHQNLFHTFAQKGNGAPTDLVIKIYTELRDKGIDTSAKDIDNKTPLHYSVIYKFRYLTEQIILSIVDLNAVDNDGNTCLHYAAINNDQYVIEKVLELGSNPNIINKNDETPFLIHLKNLYLSPNLVLIYAKYNTDFNLKLLATVRGRIMRIGVFLYLLIKNHIDFNTLETLIEYGVDINDKDLDGYSPIIYAIRQNSRKLARFILKHPQLDKNLKDNEGQTPIHHVVNPLSFGSFENVKLLGELAKVFDINEKDKYGRSPIYYARLQSSGIMYQKLLELGALVDPQINQQSCPSMNIIPIWPPDVNFSKDAEDYLQKMAEQDMMFEEEYRILPDESATNRENIEVVYNEELGAYSLYMTKVDIKTGYYGENLFYRMQVLHEKNRDIYILFTKWGRIGEIGAYQQTPFPTKEDCIAEFCKIFKEKSGNTWENKANFQKIPKKFQLMNFDKRVNHRDHITSFNLDPEKNKAIPPNQYETEIHHVMEGISSVKVLHGVYAEYSIDRDFLPLDKLSKALLLEAREILTTLNRLVDELEVMKNNYMDQNLNEIQRLSEEIADKSSRFYELIPSTQYKCCPVLPISDKGTIKQKFDMLTSLLDIEISSRIILGALHNQEVIHPYDYCYRALNIWLNPLSSSSHEYQMINQYVKNGCSNYYEDYITNIFSFERKGESERYALWANTKNKMLLWHGSKMGNFMGILYQGLRIAPPEAPATGYMFGKGVYFADVFDKSIGYCTPYYSPDYNSRYYFNQNKKKEDKSFNLLLLCEVALGHKYERYHSEYITQLNSPYQSTKGIGRRGPNPKENMVMPDGTIVPSGKLINLDEKLRKKLEKEDKIAWEAAVVAGTTSLYQKKQMPYYSLNYNEYIVYDVSQIKIRYLVQVRSFLSIDF